MLYYVTCQPRINTTHHFMHVPWKCKHMHTLPNMDMHSLSLSYMHTHSHHIVDCLFISLRKPTWAVAWSANHIICHVAVTTGLTLHPAQFVPIELTGFSCSEGMSTQECTNQSYFTWSTPWLNHSLPSSSLTPAAPSFFAFSVSPEHTVRGTLNDSDKLFTRTIMSRFWLRGTTISSLHLGTWASVTALMNSTTGISINFTLIKRSVLHHTCICRDKNC